MTIGSVLADVAAIATALGFPAAGAAGYFALRSLGAEADSQKLTSILETNRLWDAVGEAACDEVALSPITVRSIRLAYERLGHPQVQASVVAPGWAKSFSRRAPFIAAALLPSGNPVWGEAPVDVSELHPSRASAYA
jgi:hypothetical protein